MTDDRRIKHLENELEGARFVAKARAQALKETRGLAETIINRINRILGDRDEA